MLVQCMYYVCHFGFRLLNTRLFVITTHTGSTLMKKVA